MTALFLFNLLSCLFTLPGLLLKGRAGLILAALPLLLSCLGIGLAAIDVAASNSMAECEGSLMGASALALGLPGCLAGLLLKVYLAYWRSNAGETGPGLSRSTS